MEQHIKICENCRKIYHEMQETVNGGYLSEQDLEQMGRKADFKGPSEIDYLKKIRRKNRMRILAAVLTVVIVVGCRDLVQGICHWARRWSRLSLCRQMW